MKVRPVKAAQILLPLAWTQALQQFLRMRRIAFSDGLRDHLDPSNCQISGEPAIAQFEFPVRCLAKDIIVSHDNDC